LFWEGIDPANFVARPYGTPFPLYALLAGLIIDQPLEVSPGITLEPVDSRVFSHPMLSVGVQENGKPSPGPWAQVYGASQHHNCLVEMQFQTHADKLFPRSPMAISIMLAVIRLSCPKFVRCPVAAGRAFTAENIGAGLKPVAFELHFPQSGPFDTNSPELTPFEAGLLQRLSLPIAHAFQDVRFYRAYQIFDQAQWCTSPDAALALIWASIEHLLEIGDARSKGDVMAREIARRLCGFRAGSVCLNSFRAVAKWISALVMPQPGLAAAR
jgi:hypothetical protein